MGKVYEKLVRKHMVDHVGKLIAPEQHGFLPGRSCTSNLLDSMDVILDMIDDGLPVKENNLRKTIFIFRFYNQRIVCIINYHVK